MTFLIIFLVALAVSAVGFHRYIWFISIGYGFSIAAIGTALLIMFGVRHELTAVTAIMAALLVVYGLRLGGYLLAREYRSSSYHKVMQQAIDNGNNVKLPLRLLTWVGCALLYACEASPIAFRLQNHAGTDAVAIVGAAIMGVGIILESAADLTKNRFKQQHPHRFCDVGLFRMVRCPSPASRYSTAPGNGSPQSAATCASAGSCSAARADSSCGRTRNMQTTRNTGTIPNTHRFSSRSSRCIA